MFIERIQIEEGFLGGLDITLCPGLNVLIGARGTGKTSLIELVRFALDVKGYTAEATKRSRDHALSVLGSGQVTVTLSDQGRKIIATRSATDATSRNSGPFAAPIIMSQTEIEAVGLEAAGRLRLLDGFASGTRQTDAGEADAAAIIRSMTTEIEAVRREIDDLGEQLAEVPALDSQIAELAPAEKDLTKVSAESAERKRRLDAISTELTKASVAVAALQRFEQTTSRWLSAIRPIAKAPAIEAWPKGAGEDQLANLRHRLASSEASLQTALTDMSQTVAQAHDLSAKADAEKLQLDEQARSLRIAMEALQSGAGETIRKGQLLRERKAKLESLKVILTTRQAQLTSLLAQRNLAFEKLDQLRQARFSERQRVVSNLNKVLGPRIRIEASREGQTEGFATAITEILKGSGLRYGDLSNALASSVTPRELVQAVDDDDAASLAQAASITKDRASRVIGQLKDADLGLLATTKLEDVISLQLLDGSTYKDITEVSTGQRCSVVLPLVLRHTDRILIVDQPEDHIDNGFIADTLIRALKARDPAGQIIFSTHNANIPVLGEADRVIHMGSDGRRGFVLTSSELDDAAVVTAITNVMEGGAAAFSERSRFYSQNKSP